MAENNKETPKSRREMVAARLQTRYPDREFADDEAMFGQIDDDYNNYDSEIGKYQERENKMVDMFAKNPRAAQFIKDMADDKDPYIALIERLGAEGITDLMNNPEKKEAYAKANADYLERIATERDLEEQYNKNFGESLQLLGEIQRERNLSDETIDAAMDLVSTIVHDAVVGKYTRETIEAALNMLSRDADISNARSEGEVAGRNAKIEEQLRRPKTGDGMPAMGGSSAMPTNEDKKLNFFDIAEAAR